MPTFTNNMDENMTDSLWPRHRPPRRSRIGLVYNQEIRTNPLTREGCEIDALVEDPDFEYLINDSTIVRAHAPSAGAKGGLKIRPSDEVVAGG